MDLDHQEFEAGWVIWTSCLAMTLILSKAWKQPSVDFMPVAKYICAQVV